ncbi:hypothetical protein K502DRAFT_345118 [Neoconidiobolus thromboides FSU 785]|nr:hypothetical protein K502DRAFT_345118 [Neoconidiobolus thromboides FSU 785]
MNSTIVIKEDLKNNIELEAKKMEEIVSKEVAAEKKQTRKKPRQFTASNKEKTIEIRNGKLIFNEPLLNLLIHEDTIIELAQFHLIKRNTIITNSYQLEDQLNQFKPLIAKLIQGSDKTITDLALFLKGILCPTGFLVKDKWEDILVPELLENIIQKLASRVSYGIPIRIADSEDYSIPEGLTVYRWECKDLNSNFKEDIITLINNRKQLRLELVKEAVKLYSELSIEDQEYVVLQATITKKKRKHEAIPVLIDVNMELKPNEAKANQITINEANTAKMAKVNEEKKKQTTKSSEEKKKQMNKINEEKKKQISKTIEEKKLPRHTVSIKGFFTVKKDTIDSNNSNEKNTQLPIISDYEKYFHPFRVKQGVYIAKSLGINNNKFDLVDKINSCKNEDYNNEMLKEIQNKLKSVKKEVNKDMKEYLNHMNDMDSINSEDDSSIIMLSTETTGYKPKLLMFHENVRPPFFGVWLPQSNKIKPRNFKNKDEELLNYEFDSELEWQEEDEEGELLDDSDEDEDEDDEDFNSQNNNSESENDDWLIEEDGEEEEDIDKETKKMNVVNKSKRRQPLVLNPILVGVCCSSEVNENIKIKQLPISNFAYSLVQDGIKLPLDPFEPISSSTTLERGG